MEFIVILVVSLSFILIIKNFGSRSKSKKQSKKFVDTKLDNNKEETNSSDLSIEQQILSLVKKQTEILTEHLLHQKSISHNVSILVWITVIMIIISFVLTMGLI